MSQVFTATIGTFTIPGQTVDLGKAGALYVHEEVEGGVVLRNVRPFTSEKRVTTVVPNSGILALTFNDGSVDDEGEPVSNGACSAPQLFGEYELGDITDYAFEGDLIRLTDSEGTVTLVKAALCRLEAVDLYDDLSGAKKAKKKPSKKKK